MTEMRAVKGRQGRAKVAALSITGFPSSAVGNGWRYLQQAPPATSDGPSERFGLPWDAELVQSSLRLQFLQRGWPSTSRR